MATLLQRSSCAAAALVALLPSAAARADDILPPPTAVDPTATVASPAQPTRRGSLAVGVMLGVGAASIVGYPNDVTKIGYASWYTVTGARPATLSQLWIGAAVTDWFTLGVGGSYNLLLDTGSNTAMSYGVVFRVEAFPLFPLGGQLRDLGVLFEAGPYLATVKDASGTAIVDSALASLVGGGIFYEGIHTWKIAQGPYLVGDYLWSDTARRPAIFAGWRVSLYRRP
jgi:hypothetical protein